MLNLILTILCSTSIALILKINGNIKGNTLLLLAGNYFSASLVGIILLLNTESVAVELKIIPFSLFLSLLFTGSIFAYSKSVILSGAALSTVSSRLSVIVPVILSMIIYNELPGDLCIIGLLLTTITIVLFYYSIKDSTNLIIRKNKFLYLIGVLVGIGIADFFMKVFQENWTANDKPWFLFWIFFFSFLITFYLSLKRRISFNRSSLLLGVLMGIPNIFSSFFLIETLKEYEAIIVFPLVNISIIVATAIIVKLIWKEKWDLFAKYALLSGILAIVLLTL